MLSAMGKAWWLVWVLGLASCTIWDGRRYSAEDETIEEAPPEDRTEKATPFPRKAAFYQVTAHAEELPPGNTTVSEAFCEDERDPLISGTCVVDAATPVVAHGEPSNVATSAERAVWICEATNNTEGPALLAAKAICLRAAD